MPIRTSLTIALAGALGIACCSVASAQLVVDGETIADAATYDAARKEGALMHYGNYLVEQMAPIFKAFEADTGIKTDYVRLPAPPLFNRVVSEFEAKKLEADSLDIADQSYVDQLVARGILAAPHKAPADAAIPADLKDPQGRWYTVYRIITSAIVVNTGRVDAKEAPQKLADILDPKWKGLIGMTSIEGVSSLALDLFMLDKLGPGYEDKIAALSPRIYPFVGPLVTDISRGEVGIAIGAIAEPVLSQIKSGAPLKLVFAPEGVGSFPTASGVISSAKHPNAARLFLDWRTSKRGGMVIATTGAYPANPGAGSPRVGDVVYPPPDKVWNMKASDWDQRTTRTELWRRLLGTK
jgi:iron(III) transport system substrate-binding protein